MEILKPSLLLIFFAFIFVFSCSDKSTNPTGELNDLTNPAGGRINKLVIDSRSNFYAGTPAGLEQSTDYGKTWKSLTKSINTVLNVLEIEVTSDNYIFISSYSFNSFSLLRTSDNGTSWSEWMLPVGTFYPGPPLKVIVEGNRVIRRRKYHGRCT